MIRSALLTAAGVLLAVPSFTAAETYLVTPDGAGDYPTIQAAIDATVDGDVIELSDGIFTGAGNRDLDYGGREITIRSQSGNAEGCMIDCQGAGRAFHFQSGEGIDAVLEDVTITGGSSEGPQGEPASVGGAIYCHDGTSPSILRCRFVENRASYWGGAIALAHEASPFIEECQFLSNYCAGWGGAIGSVADSYPEITRCLFRQNEAEIAGGAVFCSFSSSPVVTYCTFDSNSSFHGGAIECQSSASPSLIGCTFYRNDATTGTSLRAWDGSFPEMQNCILAFGRQGQAVFCHSGGSATLTCCDLYGNEGGDWVGCIAGQEEIAGNQTADPLLCNPGADEFGLAADSPCAPENSNGCDLIGAWPVLCDVSPVIDVTWGRIRAGYR